ncbi:MAG: ATP synthase F1 subunit epsilon [Candidatus Paceibacterota bacterium]
MADKKFIKFEIVSPERKVFEAEITQATIPTKEGEVTILPEHIPLVTSLIPGVIEIKTSKGDIEILSVSGGFLEVLNNKISILADTAERAHEIDISKAEEARKTAEKIKEEAVHTDREHFTDAYAKIEKQLAREKAAKRWRKLKNIEQLK